MTFASVDDCSGMDSEATVHEDGGFVRIVISAGYAGGAQSIYLTPDAAVSFAFTIGIVANEVRNA